MWIAKWPRATAMLVALVFPAEARGDVGAVTIAEKPDHVTEASVTIDATPAQIYGLVTDYARWTTVLGDISSVSVISGGRRDAKVRFSSRVLEHEIIVKFDNREDTTIHFVGVDAPPGARATGTYTLQPVDGGRRTRVIARLYLDVVGVPGLFVRNSTLRSMRQAKLRADLSDVARWFEKPSPPRP